MKMVFDAGKLGGYGTLKTYRMVDGKRVNERDRGVFKNLVTNKALNVICFPHVQRIISHPLSEFIWIGSGGSLPKYTDTKAESYINHSQVGSWVLVNSDFSSKGYILLLKKTVSFTPSGSAYNVAELGLGTNTIAYTRALVRDALGAPVSLSIKAGEYLDVTYYFRYSFQMPSTCSISVVGHPSVASPITASLIGNREVSSYTAKSGDNFWLNFMSGESGGGSAVVSNQLINSTGSYFQPNRALDANGNFILSGSATNSPQVSVREFKSISGFRSGKSSTGILIDLGQTVSIPANYEMKVTLGFSFSRDPEPTE